MEKKNKKKNYYTSNKKYYPKKKKEVEVKEKMTYEKIVNVRNDASEIVEQKEIVSNDSIIMVVAISIIILAIVFGSLLLFHLI